MKKLLLVAIMALGVMGVQAAAVDWKVTCGNMKDHTGAAFSGKYDLYAIGGDLASDILVLSVASAGTTFNQYAFTVDSGMTPGQEYKFYYVLTDSAGYKFTSNPTANTYQALSVGATNIGFGNQATATTEGTWTAAPEPTSAMLLLIGMAGLALKRKRV